MVTRSIRRAVGATVLLLSAVPASASASAARLARTEASSPQTITFGAPLTEPPDGAFCGAAPNPPGGSSCMWSTPLNPADPAQGLTTPVGTGTIIGVRIRVGATTGPMSLVVLQAERNLTTQAVSCCQATVVTQPFLPTPNRINAFRTDLPVHTDALGQQTGDGVQITDMLALAVLNSTTPVPVLSEPDASVAPTDEVTSPAPLQGQTVPMVETSGYQLDMQATWVPGTPAPATPRVRFASGRVFVSHGYLHVPLRCRYDTCNGTIVVTGNQTRAGVTYAQGPFRIGQNLYRSIAVPLTAAGESAARAGARIRTTIELRYRTPSGSRRIAQEAALRF